MNRLLLLPTAGALLLTGCGATSVPCVTGSSFVAQPATATADHAAMAPGNQQKFNIESGQYVISGSCPISALVALLPGTWTNPDPIDIDISSAADVTNGLATCKGPTNGAVTLTASSGTGPTAKTTSVQLTCK